MKSNNFLSCAKLIISFTLVGEERKLHIQSPLISLFNINLLSKTESESPVPLELPFTFLCYFSQATFSLHADRHLFQDLTPSA